MPGACDCMLRGGFQMESKEADRKSKETYKD